MTDLDKELEEIFNDPLLNITQKEAELFNIPEDMRKAMESKKKPDYIAQHKLCDNFKDYQPLFKQMHKELKTGQRTLMRVSKTVSLEAGHFYITDGQMLLLESIGDLSKDNSKGSLNGRTRCVYENGTESDILLQTLRKNVVSDGYAITETQGESESKFFTKTDIKTQDKITGYIYVLRSLSDNTAIKEQKDLYKIGFSTATVEERISNAQHEPTYLMAQVEIVASYKVVNLHSQKFEDIIHQILKPVRFHLTVTDDKGNGHEPKEWFVVPLNIVNLIIEKILDGTIINYNYNPQMQCLEKVVSKQKATFDTSGMKILTLNIKKVYFDEIIRGEKKIEYRELKQTTLNRYTYLDETDGKRYLRRYDALRLFVGYHKDRESALVQVMDITYNERVVEYHLGSVIHFIHTSEPCAE